MNRDFKGIWISKEIWLNKDLSTLEKVFFVEISSLDNEEGCFASNAYFSDFFGISKSRCTQIISSLKAKNLIEVTIKRKAQNTSKRIIRVSQKIARGYSKKLNTVSQYSKHGIAENCEYSNTFNNPLNKKKEISSSSKTIKKSSHSSNAYHKVLKPIYGHGIRPDGFVQNESTEKLFDAIPKEHHGGLIDFIEPFVRQSKEAKLAGEPFYDHLSDNLISLYLDHINEGEDLPEVSSTGPTNTDSTSTWI